jgi:ABC-type bacteriocin/lantibiotic exporter with double-glycine peptidase domain
MVCRKGLFSGCAVILVTHAVQYLSRATNVLVLHDSRVAFHGSHRQVHRKERIALYVAWAVTLFPVTCASTSPH